MNPFSREAMKQGVDWASSRRPRSIEKATRGADIDGDAASAGKAAGRQGKGGGALMLARSPEKRNHMPSAAVSAKHTNVSLVRNASPPRCARHAKMVEEARKH